MPVPVTTLIGIPVGSVPPPNNSRRTVYATDVGIDDSPTALWVYSGKYI